MLENKKAFTILEMIVVLLIVSTISFVTINGIREITIRSDVNNIAKLIGTKFNLGQNLAQLNNEKYELEVNKDINLKTTNRIIFHQKIKDDITITSNFNNNTISINERGNISRAGTIKVQKGKYVKEIVFSIGSGSYDIR